MRPSMLKSRLTLGLVVALGLSSCALASSDDPRVDVSETTVVTESSASGTSSVFVSPSSTPSLDLSTRTSADTLGLGIALIAEEPVESVVTLEPTEAPTTTEPEPEPIEEPMVTEAPEQTVQAEPAEPAYVVSPASGVRYPKETMNVRSGPGTQYPIVGTLSGGEAVTVTGVVDGWYQVGDGRFASGAFLLETKPAPVVAEAAPAPAPSASAPTAPTPAPTPPPAPKPKPAPKPQGLDLARQYLTAAGCGSVGIRIDASAGNAMLADWYNGVVLVGPGMPQSRYHWAATHECQHFKQVWQYGSVDAVWNHFGTMSAIECDADRRTSRFLGWSAGAYC